MRELIGAVSDSLQHGHSVELVSIVASGGSTPRRAGAMLAVFSDGTTQGTVGGGNVEYEAIQLAQKLLKTGKNDLRSFRFVQGDVTSLGMVCGGEVTLHFQFLSAEDEETLILAHSLQEAVQKTTAWWLVRQLEGAEVRFMALTTRPGVHDAPAFPTNLLQSKGVFRDGWLVLPVTQPGKVYIFGGGHVSQALVPALAAVDFRPIVYDDRPEFTDPVLFPQAAGTIHASFAELDHHVIPTHDDYIVIMTRGHEADYEVLRKTLRTPARYIGCIGSRKKLALCRERLLEAGFTAEEYARVHAPIGLAIGAETPAEIAVSVTAELIAVRAGRNRQNV